MLIGEQHISKRPDVIGYDQVIKIDRNHVDTVAPAAIEVLGSLPHQPFFLSVGFFETHREFFEPSSVRDALYSLPPANLPDTPQVRRDMAAFKASARSLDQGVGAVLEALDEHGLSRRHPDRVHHRPRVGVPRGEGHAVRPRPGRDADPARTRRLSRRQGA